MHGVELLNQLAAGWAGWAVAGVIEAAILLGFVALVLLVAGKRLPAAAAHLALLVVLVKAMLPIGIPVPRPELSPWFDQAAEPIEQKPVSDAAGAIVATPTSQAASTVNAPVAAQAEARIAEVLPVAASATVAVEPLPAPAWPLVQVSWQAYAMFAWLVVSTALALRVVYLQWRLRRAFYDAFGCASEALESMVCELAGRLGIRRTIGVVMGPADISPAIAGCWRPTLIVPRGLESRLSREQLEWVLLHELAHVRRGDLTLLALERVVECFAWFNPAVWLAAHWAEHYRECACDELALGHSACGRAECGEAFLALLAGGATRPSLAMEFLPHGRLRKHRMRRLLDTSLTRKVFGKRLSAAFVAGAIVLATLSLGEHRAVGELSSEPKPGNQIGNESAANSNAPDPLDEAQPIIDRIWKQQKSEIHSARMRVKVLHLSKSKESPVQQGHDLSERAQHDMNSLLDRTDFTRPDCFRKLRDDLLVGNLILDHPAYQTIDLAWRRTKGDYARYRMELDDKYVFTYAKEAGVEYVPRDREAFVHRSPRFMQESGLNRLQDRLWYSGPEAFSSVLRHHEGDPQASAVKRLSDGSMQIAMPGTPLKSSTDELTRIVVLETTAAGHPKRLEMHDALHANPLRELDFQEYPGGIVFPRVRVSQFYSDPTRLQNITVTMIEHAEFNVDIPDSEFRMAVPANTAVWDRRGPLKLRAAEVDTKDVLTLFER